MNSFDPLAVPCGPDAPEACGFVPCEGGVCAAAGVRAAGVSAGFRKNPNRLDLALVAADEACVAAATFTTNRFCAAPVTVSRAHVADGHARAIVLNSGNANAATGEPGLAAAPFPRLSIAQDATIVRRRRSSRATPTWARAVPKTEEVDGMEPAGSAVTSGSLA